MVGNETKPEHSPTHYSHSQYEKPPKQTASEAFRTFFYNPKTGAFMGRTASSWGKIGLFYLIFYGVLAALVAICFWIFLQTIDYKMPKWQLESSLIGTNPGLGFRPMPPVETVDSTLVWFKATEPSNVKKWVDSLNDFLKAYKVPAETAGRGTNIYKCDYNLPPGPGQVCTVDIGDWHPCTKDHQFEYQKSSPCIFLKLNKIFGWKPEFYNSTEALPAKMPGQLKSHIAYIKNHYPHQLNTVWVTCEGENPADTENVGPVRYIPHQGFPGYYYPFNNTKGYLSPLVAIHFERPKPGILINVECKAWAKNIHHNRNERIGSVHFELLVD